MVAVIYTYIYLIDLINFYIFNVIYLFFNHFKNAMQKVPTTSFHEFPEASLTRKLIRPYKKSSYCYHWAVFLLQFSFGPY